MNTSVLLLICFVAVASASANFQKTNTTTKASPSNRVTAKSARSDYHHHGYDHHYPHHYGGHHLGYGHHKEFEHYLMPMLVVLGLGVLFMPLLSVLMTTMVGNVPVTTLVSGRRRREAVAKPVDDKTILKLWKKFGKAIEAFSKDDK